ncbi:MAG: AI-2E family transporter, partial [Bacteroidetes bacterium]|nr:AI-2E family transporter [Bacteroidota bacterium]
MDIQKNTYALISFILIIVILYFGKSILTPIVGAFLAWFIIKEMLYYIDKIRFGKVKIPRFIQITLAFAIVFFALFFIGNILGHNAESIQRNLPKYQQNLNEILANNSLLQRFNINDFFLKNIEKINFASLVGTAINSLSSMFSSAVLVVLYLVFIFLESNTFKQKIDAIYSNADEQSKVENILNTIDFSLSKYLSLKTLTSALTGVLSFIVLSIIGVDFAVFWAFLIFLLNFIPNIGSMIATAFPAIMALVQSGNLVMPL